MQQINPAPYNEAFNLAGNTALIPIQSRSKLRGILGWCWIKRLIILIVLVSNIFIPLAHSFAQNADISKQDQQTQLQQQLDEIEKQIAEYQQQLDEIKGQKNTLQNKINQLKKQQSALSLQIQATNLKITDLEKQQDETQRQIDEKTLKSKQLQEQITQTIRLINEYDGYPFLYAIIAQGSLSNVIDNIEYYAQLTDSLKNTLEETKTIKIQLDQHKQDLEEQQGEAENLLAIKTLQQQQLSGTVSEHNVLLQQTKGREADYQIVINDTQRRAGEIRSRIYQLLGVSSQITFGEAVKIAQWASSQTGVRVAFLLAVLTQESNLGKNIGTCNRPGDPPEKSWRVVMKPDRDQQPFLQITAELGMNPDITPVSCPMRDSRGRQVGWGGAMGPAQFIPSTWMGYKDSVSAITGKFANPWDIRDAFLAAAIKLKAGGAGTADGEWAAAMRYFSGSTSAKYRFYGDSVLSIASQYQSDIEALGN